MCPAGVGVSRFGVHGVSVSFILSCTFFSTCVPFRAKKASAKKKLGYASDINIYTDLIEYTLDEETL